MGISEESIRILESSQNLAVLASALNCQSTIACMLLTRVFLQAHFSGRGMGVWSPILWECFFSISLLQSPQTCSTPTPKGESLLESLSTEVYFPFNPSLNKNVFHRYMFKSLFNISGISSLIFKIWKASASLIKYMYMTLYYQNKTDKCLHSTVWAKSQWFSSFLLFQSVTNIDFFRPFWALMSASMTVYKMYIWFLNYSFPHKRTTFKPSSKYWVTLKHILITVRIQKLVRYWLVVVTDE